jgi:hypothetical protein
MLLVEFFTWWYGLGWQHAAKGSLNLVNKVQLSFSIPVLLRTLFSPWKRIISPSGRSIDDKMRALLDNLMSRTIGFFVRIFSLIAAVILVVLAACVGIIMSIAWPLIPGLVVISLVKGIVG